jgi:hypothetical protein
MKRMVSALLAVAVLAALAVVTTTSKHTVRALYAQSGCSVATLTGNYAVSGTGFTTPRSPEKGHEDPIAAVGVLAFDGAGNISFSYTFAFLGVIYTNQTGSGTYTLNSDCTGSISFTTGDAAGATFNVVIIGGGAEIFGIDTRASFTDTFDAQKQ